MLPFQNLIILDKNGSCPIYKQISNRLANLIQDGIIQPGAYLPATRQMTQLLNINRKTVVNAYEDLLFQDWIEAVPRKGYRVTLELPIIKPKLFQLKNNFIANQPESSDYNKAIAPSNQGRKIVSTDLIINDGFPDTELAPFQKIGIAYRDLTDSKIIKRLMVLRDEGGLDLLKESTRKFLNDTRGLNINKGNIIITRGAQMAIYITATILLSPGDNVVVSEPNYMFATDIMINSGANIISIPVDEQGIDVDYLERVLQKQSIRLLYIVPHHHHPTTVTMSISRREKLLDLIHQYNFYTIEDDYDYDFHYQYNPILPLASAKHGGKIIYIGSFTKLLAPSVRVGYMIAAPDIIEKAIHLRRLIDLRGDTFMEYMLAQMINNGDLSQHIRKSNKIYSQRCNLTCDLLSRKLSHAINFTKPQGGLAIWLRFKEKYPINQILIDATENGLIFIGTTFQKDGDVNNNSLRFGFASLTEKEIEKAINILVKITT